MEKSYSLSKIIEWLEKTQSSIDVALSNSNLGRARELRKRETLFMKELNNWRDNSVEELS